MGIFLPYVDAYTELFIYGGLFGYMMFWLLSIDGTLFFYNKVMKVPARAMVQFLPGRQFTITVIAKKKNEKATIDKNNQIIFPNWFDKDAPVASKIGGTSKYVFNYLGNVWLFDPWNIEMGYYKPTELGLTYYGQAEQVGRQIEVLQTKMQELNQSGKYDEARAILPQIEDLEKQRYEFNEKANATRRWFKYSGVPPYEVWSQFKQELNRQKTELLNSFLGGLEKKAQLFLFGMIALLIMGLISAIGAISNLHIKLF